MLGVARAGRRLVAVGERGIVIISDDDGRDWQQVDVPSSVTLTNVTFVSASTGWAVGHSGIVLKTTDAGATWRRQLDGSAALRLLTADAARATGPAAPGLRALVRQLGTDSPFLTAYFSDARSGIIAGANGLIFATRDGGATWTSRMSHVVNPDGLHYYAIAGSADELFLAGEQGRFFHSTDRGATFVRLHLPYDGTFFAVASARPREFLVGGLRGNAFFSTDDGRHVVHIPSPVPVSISAIVVRADGSYELTDQGGTLLTYRRGEATLRLVAAPPLPPLSNAVEAADGSIETVGFGGATRLPAAGSAR